jgi:hypothetical protein
MMAFQTYCAEVPRWNQDIIDEHVNKILDGCRCDYVEELVTAVFIAHTKMLTAVRMNNKQKKLQITLPKLDHFLHRVFVECARALWKAPFLLSNELSSIERQKNILQLESMFSESMSNAVRSLLPVKSILREYLEEGDEDGKEEGKEISKEETKESADAPTTIEELDEKETTAESIEPVEESVNVEPVKAEAKTEDAAAIIDDASPKTKPKSVKQTIKLEKMETPPGAPTPVGSDHTVVLPSVAAGVQVAKEA